MNVKGLRMGHQVDVDYFEAVKRKDITDRHEGYHYVLKKKKKEHHPNRSNRYFSAEL